MSISMKPYTASAVLPLILGPAITLQVRRETDKSIVYQLPKENVGPAHLELIEVIQNTKNYNRVHGKKVVVNRPYLKTVEGVTKIVGYDNVVISLTSSAEIPESFRRETINMVEQLFAQNLTTGIVNNCTELQDFKSGVNL